MGSEEVAAARIDIIQTYFRKVGAGDVSLIELFAEDFTFHFPKFGVGKGKGDFALFAARGGASLRSIGHNIADFRYIVGGDDIVVEGTEFGVMTDGVQWPDYRVSQGRFCSVFSFDGMLIRRMFIYVDPDFTSADTDRIRIYALDFDGR